MNESPSRIKRTPADAAQKHRHPETHDALPCAAFPQGGNRGLAVTGSGGAPLQPQPPGLHDLLVGQAYTTQLALEPGDAFEIKLGRKQIKLIPLGAAEEE